MSDRSRGSASHHPGSQRPPLAPRASRTSPSPNASSAAATGRPARLSHRSRAGCWTCRGRKVKCDEAHPRCGPCTRLNRQCDWEHRWNFLDATTSTQSKHTNVTTAGNVVWDPDVIAETNQSPRAPKVDTLPPFASLSTDEDREQKAETWPPGTFSVVATPESFSDLPEYSSSFSTQQRRMSVGSRSVSQASSSFNSGQLSISHDPNTILLDRFEDVNPQASLSYSASPPIRRGSIPDGVSRLSIASPKLSIPSGLDAAPINRIATADTRLVSHFQQYVVYRLVQPTVDIKTRQAQQLGSVAEMFVAEAKQFEPLHHAICALAALNLSYSGQCSLQEALEHYHDALSAATTPTTPDDLLSDGVFLRHYLLLIYDICVPMGGDDSATVMWAQHLSQLRTIMLQRCRRLGREPRGYILWSILQLDVYACLLGSGTGGFARTAIQEGIVPPIEHQIPTEWAAGSSPYLDSEIHVFPNILRLNEGVVLFAANVAQLARQLHLETDQSGPPSADTNAQNQARVTHLQMELLAFWDRACSQHLGRDLPEDAQSLPPRPRFVLEQATTLYHAVIIYLRTSMYPHQRTYRTPSDVQADTEQRCQAILSLASSRLNNTTTDPHEDSFPNGLEHRNNVFPIFLAGVTSVQPDAKLQAINLIRVMESGGIGQNTLRTRQLLVAVCEEQRKAPGRMEDVDWKEVAVRRGWKVVNCGL